MSGSVCYVKAKQLVKVNHSFTQNCNEQRNCWNEFIPNCNSQSYLFSLLGENVLGYMVYMLNQWIHCQRITVLLRHSQGTVNHSLSLLQHPNRQLVRTESIFITPQSKTEHLRICHSKADCIYNIYYDRIYILYCLCQSKILVSISDCCY